MAAGSSEYDAIVVLGAARSGTKLLRSLIGASDTVRVIPYDVNYVWRWGNEHHPDDALPPDAVTERQRPAIRRKLWAMGKPRDSARKTLVEKTVGNVLRIPFVVRTLPKARYVYLIRDGRDVVESAMRCWREPPRMQDLLPKMRMFPWLRSSGYAVRYARSALGRLLGSEAHVRTWGPVYPGMTEDASRLPLLDVCAKQWLACADAFDADRATLPVCHVVRYEDLARDPSRVAKDVARFLLLPDGDHVVEWAMANVLGAHVGRHQHLAEPDRDRLDVLLGAKLESWGFARHG